jgi:hypothetical protein
MSLGKMNSFIDIVSTVPVTKDSEGFATKGETILASVRAYKEERRGTEKWANMTAFSEASVLFRFRNIPGVTVSESLTIICEGKRFRIIDTQYGRGHGMYVECLCSMLEGSVS